MPRVLLFGALADAAGWREREVAGGTLETLKAELAKDPRIAEGLAKSGLMTIVDRVVVRGDLALAATAEVAFAPPVSGG